jgi:hypothetical protein
MKRATFILDEKNIKKIKGYAFKKNIKITDAINIIVSDFFKVKK